MGDWFKGDVARALNGTSICCIVNIRNLYYEGMNNLIRVINFFTKFLVNLTPVDSLFKRVKIKHNDILNYKINLK